MNGLRLALGCLTILPGGPRGDRHDLDFGGAWMWFPVIGLGIGAMLVGVHTLLSRVAAPLPLAAGVLIVWVIVTGALHLDGLGDVCDGLMGGATREERLRIMKDPHVGAMAVVAITTLLIAKFALLSDLLLSAPVATLLLSPCLGRYTMVLLGTTLPSARADGMAAPFVQQARRSALLLTTVMTAAACVVVRGVGGLGLFAVVLVTTAGLRALCARALGGVTGDALGAAGELIELVGLCGLAW